MHRSFAFFVALAFAGCSVENLSTLAFRNAWEGATYEEVVSRWGEPASATSLKDGRTSYTWVDQASSVKSDFLPTSGQADNEGKGEVVGDQHAACWRTLIVENNRVSEQTWHGPSNYCFNFAR